jgi:N6-adenosine-specific RNA methylase IME4
MEKTTLVHFERAREALVKAKTIDEVKAVRNMAERLRLYLKQEKQSLEMQNHAAAIRLRAERRAGEMLKETKKNGQRKGDGRPKNPDMLSGFSEPTLKEIGVNEKQCQRWQAIAAIPDEKFEQFIEETTQAEEELTQSLALRYARREANIIELAELSARTAPLPSGLYSCLVIDPPWPMEKIELDKMPWQVGFDYPTMSEEELAAWPLPQMADADCHLYLWTTHKYLPTALRLAERWGFNYQCLMTWVKSRGFTPFSWMYSTEHVLFCRKGNLPLLKLGMRLDFQGKSRQHSRKPDEFYDIVRQASPAPRLDIFGREQREGFDVYGNEPDKFEKGD